MPELKQRLVAILAADAAGYSRLMSLDEHGTVAALDAARNVFRQQIEAKQGRVIDLAGDSVLAVFESAAGAVGGASGCQARTRGFMAHVAEDRRMRFRIGVHLGDVIEKPDGTVYGDGVNIAARLQTLAEPGGIIVSDAIRGAVKGQRRRGFVDLGEQRVKNIAEPVRAFKLLPADPSATAHAVVDMYAPVPGFGGRPAIAVLPFANLSGDPEQEYFADGLAEDILTRLALWRWLPVIARNSSFSFKGPCSRRQGGRPRARRALRARRQRAQGRQPGARDWPVDRRRDRASPVGRALRPRARGPVRDPGRADRRHRRCARRRGRTRRSRARAPQAAGAASTPGISTCVGGGTTTRFTREDFAIAGPLLRRAVELDPDFAGRTRGSPCFACGRRTSTGPTSRQTPSPRA